MEPWEKNSRKLAGQVGMCAGVSMVLVFWMASSFWLCFFMGGTTIYNDRLACSYGPMQVQCGWFWHIRCVHFTLYRVLCLFRAGCASIGCARRKQLTLRDCLIGNLNALHDGERSDWGLSAGSLLIPSFPPPTPPHISRLEELEQVE